MLYSFSGSLELLQTAVSNGLYIRLVDQIRKDFGLANVSLQLVGDISPQELIDSLKEKIFQLILEHFPEYLNLMYVIDVPEKAFKELKMTDAVEVADQVVFFVLKREYQKVHLKSHYSK